MNGFLFHHNDAADLARIVKLAASQEDIWDQMVASLPTVLTMTEVAARHMAVYADLLEQTQQRTA